jgi:hypothetical protein
MPKDYREKQDRNIDIHASLIDPSPLPSVLSIRYLASWRHSPPIRDPQVQHL